MTSSPTAAAVSRRTALAGLGAAGVGLALTTRGAAAETDLANHPLTGTWLAMANPPLPDDPQVAVPSLFAADGSVLLMFPLTQVGPQGVVYNAAGVGVWEADGERRGHFTAVQVLSDANGTFLGTITIDGYPEVNEDEQTFVDDGSKAMVTIRDAAATIVQQVTGVFDRPVTATRMGPGSPGFPTSAAATPAP